MQNNRPKEKGQAAQQLALQGPISRILQNTLVHLHRWNKPSLFLLAFPAPFLWSPTSSLTWWIEFSSYTFGGEKASLCQNQLYVGFWGVLLWCFFGWFGFGLVGCFLFVFVLFFFVCVGRYSGPRNQFWPKWNTSLGWGIYRLRIYLFKSFCYQT